MVLGHPIIFVQIWNPEPEVHVPLYPLGISRRRDITNVPKQATDSVGIRWGFSGELACAFIEAAHPILQPKLHAAALDVIHRRICVLPVRFGIELHDEAEIVALLQERSHDLLEHLSRLDQTSEMALRIAPLSRTRPDVTAVPNRQSPPDRISPKSGKVGPASHCYDGASVAPTRLVEPHGAESEKTEMRGPMKTLSGLAPPYREKMPLAYLQGRRAFYREQDGNTEYDEAMVRQFVEPLRDHYREWRKLKPSPDLCRPIGISCQPRPSHRFSSTRRRNTKDMPGKPLRRSRTVAPVQLCVERLRAFPFGCRWIGSHPSCVRRPKKATPSRPSGAYGRFAPR